MEKTLRALSDYSLLPRLQRTFGAGLKAELIFFLKNREALQLEPLLDAGAKADFTGLRDGKPVNIDVTTNVDYKDINRYSEISKKRNKLYEIALVDLKRDRVESFPLRFPFCPDCGKFSHYVLFLDQPEGSQWWASQYQELVQYCPFCAFLRRKGSYSYLVPSPLLALEDKMSYQNSEFHEKNFKPDIFLSRECAPITRFFQKESDVLIGVLLFVHVQIIDNVPRFEQLRARRPEKGSKSYLLPRICTRPDIRFGAHGICRQIYYP